MNKFQYDNENAKKFYGWTERKLKGNIAETIIEHMLEYSGYIVYRFGYEKLLQGIKDIKLSRRTETTKRFIHMPDLIAIDLDGKIEFIEVKYREKGMLFEEDKQKIKDLAKTWPDCRLIIVSLVQPNFRISRIKEFSVEGKLYNLEDDHFIKIDKQIIERYKKLVLKYYKI